MATGVVMERDEGTPQGGPLSPLLANVLLDEVDKELEQRGLAFVRYADDCNVYVRSRRAGERRHGRRCTRLYAATPAAHQRGQERGGAPVGPQIPRATASGRQGRRGQTACGPQGPWGDEGASPEDHDPKRWTET